MVHAVFEGLFGFLAHWGSSFWMTMRETSPFLVFGLLLAGVLHVLVPLRIILWALGQGGWKGAIRGALVGTPLPLCSCGVIPTALALRRRGASLSATSAFTIATPETSIDAIAVTAALLPTIFLGVRPMAALLLAVLVGTIVEFFSRAAGDELRQNVLTLSSLIDRDVASDAGTAAPEVAEICRVCGLMITDGRHGHHGHRGVARARAVFSYAFGTFFRDIATWLVLGLVFAALVQAAVPEHGFSGGWLGHSPATQVTLAILVGIPLYSCATATTPLAAVLMAKGLDPGAALALLLAGPATNIGNVFALRRELGARVTVVYYAALGALCWLFGFGFSLAWPLLVGISGFPALTEVARVPGLAWLVHGMPAWLEIASAWLLIALCVRIWSQAAFRRGSREDDGHSHHAH